MRGFATSGGVVLPVFDLAAKTGQSVSGGGGGGRGGVAFFRRFFTTAAQNTVMAIRRSDVDGSNAHNVSSDAQEGSLSPLGSEAISAQRAATARQDVAITKALRLFNTFPAPKRVSGAYTQQSTKRCSWLVSYTASGSAVKLVI